MSSYNQNNKDNSLRKRKRLITFLSILAILGMVTASYAWFTVNTFAGVDSLDLHISVSAQLKVAMEDYGTDLDKYGKTITNEMVDSYLARYDTSLEETVLDPVTSVNGEVFTNERGTQKEANDGTYLEFECYFIATEDMWVHLTTEDTSEDVDGTGGTYVTSDSPMPQGEVVQCTRVGFATDDDSAVYEPNKGTPINSLATFDLPSGTMRYSNNTRLFHLNEMEPTKATIRVWIDGEDPQCDDDVQEADLKVQLGFIGCDENNNPIA